MDFLYNNFLTDLFVMAMDGIAGVVVEYSIAIIILVAILRFAVAPLNIKMMRSQRKMAQLGPEIQSIQKRYANNPQIMQRKVQELYKKNGASPFAGCLPQIISIFIFFAFFGSMRILASGQTISLLLDAAQNGASNVALPSFLWVNNLWQPDTGFANIMPSATELVSFIQTNASYISPQMLTMLQTQGILDYSGATLVVTDMYTQMSNEIVAAHGLTGIANGMFILPAISGVAMFLSQKLNKNANQAAAADPNQAGTMKMMMYFMPILSVIICLQSNAAFTLYWAVSSLCMMLITKLTNMSLDRADKKEKQIKA